MSRKQLSRNSLCLCGSGKKYKHCCWNKGFDDEGDDDDAIDESIAHPQRQSPPKHPMGTVALYGPDDKTTTKIAAAVFLHDGAEPIIERWVGTDVSTSPKVQRELKEFFEKHGVKSVVLSDSNMGCPHEEGLDFPRGEDCPFCPFWKGKQGSARRE